MLSILRRYTALFSSFLSAILAVAFTMIFIWGETGGLYHAFKHYGVRDGLIAVFVPPYAWYRGLHFFYWLAQGATEKTQITKPSEYPELTPEEKNELYAIIDKAFKKPIYSNDLKRLKNCIEGYLNRTGLPLLYEDSEIKLFIEQQNIWVQYQYELGKCLLKSYDSKEPYVSDTLKELGEIMELIDPIYEERLEDDFNKILSVANRISYTDRFGRTRTLNREDIITGLDVMKMIEENFKRILKLCEEFEDQRK